MSFANGYWPVDVPAVIDTGDVIMTLTERHPFGYHGKVELQTAEGPPVVLVSSVDRHDLRRRLKSGEWRVLDHREGQA